MQSTNITPINSLSLFDSNKASRENFVSQVIEQVNEGFASPLDIQYYLKCIAEISKAIEANPKYKEALLDEANKFGRKFTHLNSEMQVSEAGTKYDFSQCNDPIYYELKAQAEKANEELKEREEFLKNIPIEGIMSIHEGEVLTIYPPSKSSTTILKTTLK